MARRKVGALIGPWVPVCLLPPIYEKNGVGSTVRQAEVENQGTGVEEGVCKPLEEIEMYKEVWRIPFFSV